MTWWIDAITLLVTPKIPKFAFYVARFIACFVLVAIAWYACLYGAMGVMWLLIYGAVYWVPAFVGAWLLLMIGKYGYEFLRG